MQIAGMLIAFAVWLLVFWTGSIALEGTGMDRRKARFQALSAITGTGFTTREAESIVNHPRRRRIAAWLIFLGNLGIVAFIAAFILYLKAGIAAPSRLFILATAIVVTAVILLIKLGVVDRLTSRILSAGRGGQAQAFLVTEEILYQVGEYGVVRLALGGRGRAVGTPVKQLVLDEVNATALAIERGNRVLSLPGADEPLQPGDYLLCYGRVAEMPLGRSVT